MTFERMFDGQDEMRALCVDLGYDLDDVVYDSVRVRCNVVTLRTLDRDESGDLIVDYLPEPEIRTTARIHMLPRGGAA